MQPVITIRRIPRVTVRVQGKSLPVVAAPPPGVAVVEVGLQGRPGVPGPQGPASNISQGVAGEALSALRVLRLAADGRLYMASPASLAELMPIAGISINASAQGTAVAVQRFGYLDDASFIFAPGSLLYCGASGVLTSVPPPGILAPMGFAYALGRIQVRIDQPIL